MFTVSSPESVGISSRELERFLRFLSRHGLNMHSALLLRGNTIFGEYYWRPFDASFRHRMYSETKSFVSVAIGLLAEEGKLSLDTPIADFFPDKADGALHPRMRAQTVRQMLTMTTCANAPSWFITADPDRTHEYLNASRIVRPAGTAWQYDSPGSQVLASLVERLSGKSLMEYLREKIFVHLGAFETAEMLRTPNGDSWGDSALLATPRDMLTFGRFLLNYGTWRGKRLLNEAYLREATSALVPNASSGFSPYDEQGYGYQFWRHPSGFSLNGMGSQFTVCCPTEDLVFVCTADNQGNPAAHSLIFAALEDFVLSCLSDTPLPPDPAAEASLAAFGESLSLPVAAGAPTSPLAGRIGGRIYRAEANRCGITQFSFTRDGDDLLWHYTNAQGEKTLRVGMGVNIFTKFPELGYSGDVGGVRTTDGSQYDCAVSGAWLDAQTLGIRVQIIDRYLGNLYAVFSFRGDICQVRMQKAAEAFLTEYEGEFTAHWAS